MASTTREEPHASQIVASASQLVNMEAKMVVATCPDHCQQLKDMLTKEDPSTMVVVMASGNKTSTPKPPSPVMDPRLLAAACSGSFHDLESLLNGEDRRGTSYGAIRSSARHPASGDEESFLSESLLDTRTIGGDTVLHAIATHSNGEDFFNKDGLVNRKAKNLLFVQNTRGDTPLHCAARVGNVQMVSRLIDLAREEGGNANRVKDLLETENKKKWTALHEAVRIGNNDIVKLFMQEDSQLASFPKGGESPLYLAILLEEKIIAESLYEMSGDDLSYSGPNGQNALHAAVLRDKGLTEMLLGWNNALTIQQDDNGSTPLHLCISVVAGSRPISAHKTRMTRRSTSLLLLKANPDALYLADNDGSFPIHVAAAALVDATDVIKGFLKESPSCIGLCDARGRTFIHVLFDKKPTWPIDYTCGKQLPTWILNMQDNDGNTALHLAVQSGNLRMLCSLLNNGDVHLNLTNDEGETPLDIARRNLPKRFVYNQRTEEIIDVALSFAGAKCGINRRGYLKENDIVQARQDEIDTMENVKEGTQSLCIGSVIIATMTFGAAFAMPGGYRADDHTNGGTPTLAGRYTFDAFILANALAFTFSTMATICLMISGSPLYSLNVRANNLSMAFHCLSVSITSLVAAFALGTYMLLAPVAHKTAIAVCAMSFLIYLYQNVQLAEICSLLIAPCCRRVRIVWTFPVAAFTFVVCILFNIIGPK
ncbi:ankyrin-3-like [Triticum urartu]|uniref:ankyrin-3-like n=1 Tax=Triticum urartu TaxID=4572 RepID=UPI000356D8BB|nr:ankyrin-3-like [Triticum urartu]